MRNYLQFNPSVSKNKPNSIIQRDIICPFCNLKNVEDIIDTKGSIMLLRNAFQVFDNAFQMVLIEHAECDYDFSNYEEQHSVDILKYGIEKWREMSQNSEFKSVIFYKNHGQFSGGSLHHSHMQIVGLYDIDYMEEVKSEHFEGILIHEEDNVILNMSTQPISGKAEFNIILLENYNLNIVAQYLKYITGYILNDYNFKFKSYNLYFYEFEGKIIIKITSRHVTSPYLVGYLIPEVPVNIKETVTDIQTKYFSKNI